ncbi:MAG: hypothetical protein JWN15_3673 [Firmicutes bacterium]|nr:hypothetical protein [Bacillota bacterium]
MAANPKTQMVKLAIGAVTVSSVVGITGWLWQTTHPAEASTQTAATGAGGDGQIGQGQGFTQQGGQPPQGGQSQPGGSGTDGIGTNNNGASGSGTTTPRQRRRQSGQSFGSAQPPLFADPNTQPSQQSRTRHS